MFSKRSLALVTIISILFLNPAAKASSSSGKEFMMSVIYGTLAGTLVGAASLAFTSNPGDNLNNVARGASYGLYAGILLGLYVTYGIGDDSGEPRSDQEPSIYEGNPDEKPQGNKSMPKLEWNGRKVRPLNHSGRALTLINESAPLVQLVSNQKNGRPDGVLVHLIQYHF